MSIHFYFGKPRSGKSYKAVYDINEKFISDKSNKYKYCYTNLGGLKFEQINSGFNVIDVDKKIFKLDWDKFYKHIKKLYEMSLKEVSDDELLEYMSKYKLTPCLIVIDECYRFFKKSSDPVLVWFLGYHGHLSLDIILIVHSPKLINADYTQFTEEFIVAQPRSKSLNDKTFKYKHYASVSLNEKNDLYDKSSLPVKQEIFDLYKSGDLHKPKKIIYKYIFIIIFVILFMFFLGYLFVGNVKDKAHINDTVIEKNVNYNYNSSNSSNSNDDDTFLIKFVCDNTSCSLLNPFDEFSYYSYSLDYVKKVLQYVNAKQILSLVNNYVSLNKNNEKLYYNILYVYKVPIFVKSDLFSDWFHKSSSDPFVNLSDNNTLDNSITSVPSQNN